MRIAPPAGILWLFLLAAGPFTARETAAAEAKEESSVDLLSRIQESLARVRSTYTEFEQERKLDLFDEPLRSEGVMVFDQPNRVRWETCTPYQAILVSDGVSAAQFEQMEGRWRKLQTGFPRAMKNVLDRVSAVQRGRVEDLARDYDVSAARRPDGVALILVPKAADVRKTLSAIELKLRPDLSAAQEILLKEPNGDYTRIVFRNERRNPPLPDRTFDLASPADLKTLQERVHEGPEGK